MAKNTAQPKTAEVISIVAHQLKNPLSVIKGYLEILLLEDFGKINQKQKEYLSDALENVKRMRTIVGYLLDVSRIEEKKYTIKKAAFNLSNLVEDVIADFSFWGRASNCKIFFEKPKKLSLVQGDALKVRQVVENLISNALKYKREGVGKIKVSLKKRGSFVIFSCQDNGTGISKKDFSKVFTKFYRSEEAMEADPSGTGLGLYINQAVIKLHGGKIWFKKNKKQGMTFYFTLPLWQKPNQKY